MNWPPAPTGEAPWHERLLSLRELGCRTGVVVVREVPLWGRMVLINEDLEVYCGDCQRFVAAGELGRVNNGHQVGLPNRVVSGRLLPMGDDGPGRPEPEGF